MARIVHTLRPGFHITLTAQDSALASSGVRLPTILFFMVTLFPSNWGSLQLTDCNTGRVELRHVYAKCLSHRPSTVWGAYGYMENQA